MADEKKKESSGSTGLEADVDACNVSKDELKWWHPARRFASDRCTNCGVELEQEYETANNNRSNDDNSDSARPFANPAGGKGGCSRCHRAYYCGTEVSRRVVLVVCCGMAGVGNPYTFGFASAQFSMYVNLLRVNSTPPLPKVTACINLSFIMNYYVHATSNPCLPIMTIAISLYLSHLFISASGSIGSQEVTKNFAEPVPISTRILPYSAREQTRTSWSHCSARRLRDIS